MQSGVFYLLMVSVMVGCHGKIFKDELPQILGIAKVEFQSSRSIDEFGGFGEGYTLEVYELSKNTVQAFENRSTKKLSDKDTSWKKRNWSKVPIDSSFNEIFFMGLNYSSGSDKLEKELVKIKKVLEKTGVYYSFYYKPDKYNPQDVQLFIFDTESRKLYIIENNI